MEDKERKIAFVKDKEYFEEKLLPCPFCGGEPEILPNGRNGLKIKCRHCLMGLKQKVRLHSLDWIRIKLKESWNKRV